MNVCPIEEKKSEADEGQNQAIQDDQDSKAAGEYFQMKTQLKQQ